MINNHLMPEWKFDLSLILLHDPEARGYPERDCGVNISETDVQLLWRLKYVDFFNNILFLAHAFLINFRRVLLQHFIYIRSFSWRYMYPSCTPHELLGVSVVTLRVRRAQYDTLWPYLVKRRNILVLLGRNIFEQILSTATVTMYIIFVNACGTARMKQ